jgi:hypothetical protein
VARSAKHRLSNGPTHGFNGIRFSMHIFNTAKDVDFLHDGGRVEL